MAVYTVFSCRPSQCGSHGKPLVVKGLVWLQMDVGKKSYGELIFLKLTEHNHIQRGDCKTLARLSEEWQGK
jgi:hypothetical protein